MQCCALMARLSWTTTSSSTVTSGTGSCIQHKVTPAWDTVQGWRLKGQGEGHWRVSSITKHWLFSPVTARPVHTLVNSERAVSSYSKSFILQSFKHTAKVRRERTAKCHTTNTPNGETILRKRKTQQTSSLKVNKSYHLLPSYASLPKKKKKKDLIKQVALEVNQQIH